MNKLIQFFIKQPLFVNLLTIFIIVAGAVTLKSMNRDLFPNVAYDIVIITTVYDGASPKEIEKLITIPLEKELNEVSDVKEMTSASIESFSVIAIQIDSNADDTKEVVTDIQRAVDKTKDLPVDLPDPPQVVEIESKDIPVIEVSLSGEMDEHQLQRHAKMLEEEILDLPEVAGITRNGWRDKEMWVEVDPKKGEEYHIALAEVVQALARRNVSKPSGKLMREEKEYLLRTTGEFETAEEIKEVIVRANDAGNSVRVRDIATVTDSFAEEQVVYKTNGGRAINLTVVKRESADAIDIVNKIKRVTDQYKENINDGLEINLINDFSYYLKRRLRVLVQNGFIGIVLVVLSLLFFLNPRVALVTAVGIPIAFMSAFFIMKSVDVNINLISLFGLILVLGMLVDDAIVVAENIFRYVESGKSYKEAAVIGVLEVWKPVTATILTTIAAFMPLMFMTGIMGKFIWAIPVVVIIALSVSLLEALFILPSHLSEMGRLPKTRLADIQIFKKARTCLITVTNWYEKVLRGVLKRRYRVAGGVFGLLIITVLIIKFFLPVILFPSRGIEMFFVRGKLPVGTPLEVTEEKFKEVEKMVESLPENELDDYVTQLGIIHADPHDPFTQRASNFGQIIAYLKPEADRDRTAKEITEELREKSKELKGFEEITFEEPSPGPPVGKAVAVKLRGDKLEDLNVIAEDVKKSLAKIEGVSDIRDDYEEGKGEIRVTIDEARAMRAGVTYSEVAQAIRQAYDGAVATTIKKADEEIDVRVRFPYDVKYDETSLKYVKVVNARGDLVPLPEIASYEKQPGISTVKHVDRRRTINVTANVDQGKTTSMEVASILSKEYKDFANDHPGNTITFGGEYEETSESMDSLYRAFLLAVFMIFLILASNFKSVVQPLIVMMAIPFGIVGVAISFLFHGQPLSFLALLGTVGLSGVVVNSAIILIDFINKRRSEGLERDAAVIETGRVRLRPVLITVATTVLGLFPVAYGLWGSDPILIPAALALMWGLLFSTALTLIVIPCFYTIADDLRNKLEFAKFWK